MTIVSRRKKSTATVTGIPSITQGESRHRVVKARRAPTLYPTDEEKYLTLSRRKRPTNPYPTEEKEHLTLAKYLNHRFGPYGWYHAANERIAKAHYLSKLKDKGTVAGFPDFLIFSMNRDISRGVAGMAIELKRQKYGRATDEQVRWLDELSSRGWIAVIANGAEDAIRQIEELYGKMR
jgi:hypothetical protein